MNTKEASDIAWELYKIIEASEKATGRDSSMLIANQAASSVDRILEKHPKIKTHFEIWKATE